MISDERITIDFLSSFSSAGGTSVTDAMCDLLKGGSNARADPYLMGLLNAPCEQLLNGM